MPFKLKACNRQKNACLTSFLIMSLKILSYNIHKGFDWNNRNYFLKEIKEFILSTHADIVFLQEVVGKNLKLQKKGLIDQQFEFLADQIWPHYSYAHNAIYDHGHHGNLILSKYPIETFRNVDISTNKLEKRGFLFCRIKTSKEQNFPYFYAACSHLDLLRRGRSLQYEKIKLFLQGMLDEKHSHFPLIVAGDFNDWNKKSSAIFERELFMHEVFKFSRGQYAKTYPAHFPFLCLDRIYVRNFSIIQTEIYYPKKTLDLLYHLSDHLPLFCEVDFHEK